MARRLAHDHSGELIMKTSYIARRLPLEETEDGTTRIHAMRVLFGVRDNYDACVIIFSVSFSSDGQAVGTDGRRHPAR